MVARRHHFVPQYYLKGFAVPRKKKHQTTVFDRALRKSYQTATDNVALERDFNRVSLQGVEPDALEKVLAQFEGTAAPALQRTVKSASFETNDDRAVIMNLVGLLALRNPRFREKMRKFHEDIAKAVLELALASKERWEGQMKQMREAGKLEEEPKVTFEEMKRFHEEGKYKVELNNDWKINMELNGFDTILPPLFDRKWAFLKASKNSGGFVTCDHPVTLMWSDPEMRRGPYGPGFGMKGTEVLVPLSNRVAIVGAFEIDEVTQDIRDDYVAAINGATIAHAERHVYARDMNFHYSLASKEVPRKASRLIDDKRFRPHEKNAHG
jgi:hypothetical protein